MAAGKAACFQSCGDNQKIHSALEGHMRKGTMGLFEAYADPQRALRELREYTSKRSGAKHEN